MPTTSETITATQEWVAPSDITGDATIEVWGGGGGGGFNYYGAYAGGGGEYAVKVVTLTPSSTYHVEVGSGGSGGSGRDGTTGGDSWFDDGSYLYAHGGGAGSPSEHLGGTGGLGDNTVAGGNGGQQLSGKPSSGGGGGASGSPSGTGGSGTDGDYGGGSPLVAGSPGGIAADATGVMAGPVVIGHLLRIVPAPVMMELPRAAVVAVHPITAHILPIKVVTVPAVKSLLLTSQVDLLLRLNRKPVARSFPAVQLHRRFLPNRPRHRWSFGLS